MSNKCDLKNDITVIIFFSNGSEICKKCFSYSLTQTFFEIRSIQLLDGEHLVVIDSFKISAIDGFRIRQQRTH